MDQGAYKKMRGNNYSHGYQKNQTAGSNGQSQTRQTYQVPNARAGSMK